MSRVITDIRQVLVQEADAVQQLANSVGPSHQKAVEMITCCRGKLVLSGLGKSGAIARKIAATFTSTGTPAVYIHPVEGAHGDFGLVQPDDIAILISKSGSGEELQTLIPYLQSLDLPIISITADPESLLARASTVVLHTPVEKEACPNNLAPTVSTTLALALGDALAVAVLTEKGITATDFARWHPGGALGRRLLIRVGDILRQGDGLPLVHPDTLIKDLIFTITAGRYGAVLVTDAEGRLQNVITDGDLRRFMEKTGAVGDHTAADFGHRQPKTIRRDTLAATALQKMKEYKINQLVVVDAEGLPEGILHLHDILQAGVL